MRRRGLKVSVLRSGLYLEDLAAPELGRVKEGVVEGPVAGDTYMGVVSVVDVGKAAAAVVAAPAAWAGQDLELCSENLTGDELADLLASLRKRRFTYSRGNTWARRLLAPEKADVVGLWFMFFRAFCFPLVSLLAHPFTPPYPHPHPTSPIQADFWQQFGRDKVASTTPLKQLVGAPVSAKQFLLLNKFDTRELRPQGCTIS